MPKGFGFDQLVLEYIRNKHTHVHTYTRTQKFFLKKYLKSVNIVIIVDILLKILSFHFSDRNHGSVSL